METPTDCAHNPRHIDSLDGIRGIAVILVLAVHFQNLEVLPQAPAIFRWVGNLMSWGWCGVDLFFVLSGFLITGILVDTRNDPKRFRHFYSRRIRRIFPLYYAVVLPSIAACIFLRHSSARHTLGPSPLGWITYMVYVQNWWLPFGDLHHMRFLGPFWSLGIEEQFYLVWPLFVWRSSMKTLIGAGIVGAVGALSLRWCLTPHTTTALAYVVYMNTLTRMDALLVGALCAIAVRDAAILRRLRKGMPVIVGAVAFGLMLLLMENASWKDYNVLVYGHLLLAIGFGCLVLAAYLSNNNGGPLDRILRSGPLRTFGKYSYGIYVYQGFVLEFILYLHRRHSQVDHPTVYAIGVAVGWIVIPFVTAFLSYHLLEKRFLDVRRSDALTSNASHCSVYRTPAPSC